MEKLDKRVRRSYNDLKKAFLSLLKNKPFESITVSELIDLAGYSRSTFYSHFEDKYALMDRIIKDEVQAFIDNRKSYFEKDQYLNPDSFKIILLQDLEYVYKQRDIYQQLYNLPQTANFPVRLAEGLYEDASKNFVVNTETDLDVNYYLYSMNWALVVTIGYWVRSDFMQSAKYMAELHSNIFHAKLFPVKHENPDN